MRCRTRRFRPTQGLQYGVLRLRTIAERLSCSFLLLGSFRCILILSHALLLRVDPGAFTAIKRVRIPSGTPFRNNRIAIARLLFEGAKWQFGALLRLGIPLLGCQADKTRGTVQFPAPAIGCAVSGNNNVKRLTVLAGIFCTSPSTIRFPGYEFAS